MSAVLLIAVPLLAAFLSIMFKKYAHYILMGVSIAAIIFLAFVELQEVVIGGFAAPYGINLVLDQYSFIGLYMVNILFFIVVAINCNKFKKISSILLVSLAGLNGLLLTGDLFNLFVFIEISGIAAYLITTTNKKPLATFNYLVQGTVGSSLYLVGLIILYAMFGTLNMRGIGNAVNETNAVITAFPFLLMFIGMGVEAKLLPFNSWVKGILANSNTLSGPMIASVYATAMGFVFGRLLTNVFYVSGRFELIITIVLIFSIVAGEAMAYASTKVKEILLFSSIAQAALVVLMFVSGFAGWAVMLIIANGVSKLVLFLVTNIMAEEVGSDESKALKGVFSKNLVVGVAFTVAALSAIGLPLFFGFVVKMAMLQGLFMNGYLFPAVILITSVVEGVYFIKLLTKLWAKKDSAVEVHFDFVVKYVVAALAILIIVFGVYTEPVEELAAEIQQIEYLEGGQ